MFSHLKLQQKLFIFLFTTGLGSCLSSFASFLTIEKYFNGLFYLGIALSFKTLAASIFSYHAEYFIKKLGVYFSFIASQIFGLISLFILFLGFQSHSFSLVVFGIMLTSIPTALVAILLTFTLKISTHSEFEYRKNSGAREFISGIAMLIGALLAPLLLLIINLYGVLLIDALSFILGTLLLYHINFSTLPKTNEVSSNILNSNIFKSRETWIFVIQTCASLSLVALIPIFASSSSISFTYNIPPLLRQWIWVIDALTWLLGSFIYLIAKNIKSYRGAELLIICNAILLTPLLYSSSAPIVFLVLIGISLASTISFMQFRDDYVLNAKNDIKLIASYSSFSLLQKNFVYFLSPLLISGLFSKFKLPIIIGIVIGIQGIAYLWKSLLTKKINTHLA